MRKYILYILLVLSACQSSEQQPEETKAESNQVSTPTLLELSEDDFIENDLSLVEVIPYVFGETIRANGYIDVPTEGRVSVSAYYGGYVKELSLIPGQTVSRGDILMSLENPEYLEMQQEYLSTLEQMDFLRDDFERQKVLLEENISSKKSFLKAEAEYNSARAKLEGLRSKLILLGIDLGRVEKGDFTPVVHLRSPINGSITSVNAVRGHYIQPAESAVDIINTDHIHLEIQVFEKDLPNIKTGQRLRMRLPSSENNKEYPAEVYLVGKSISGDNRIAMVHAHLLNSEDERELTTGMYIEVDFLLSSEETPALPNSAIHFKGEQAFVWVRKNEDWPARFDQLNISTGRTSGNYTGIADPDISSLDILDNY